MTLIKQVNRENFELIYSTSKLQFTKSKTSNKDVPSNTLPNVMGDEGQVEVDGLPLISR